MMPTRIPVTVMFSTPSPRDPWAANPSRIATATEMDDASRRPRVLPIRDTATATAMVAGRSTRPGLGSRFSPGLGFSSMLMVPSSTPGMSLMSATNAMNGP
jgi:hypothetical protein